MTIIAADKTMKLERERGGEEGAILVLAAILVTVLLVLMVFAITTNEWSQVRSVIRASSSTASADASAVLCSTRACYNVALISALKGVYRYPVPAGLSKEEYQAAVQEAINDLYQQLTDGVKFISGPAGKNEWTFGSVRVQVQRGRWWPRGVSGPDANGTTVRYLPTTVDETSLLPAAPIFSDVLGVTYEPKFEPFDRFDSVVWQAQAGKQGTPNFIAANAVRVRIELPGYKSIFPWSDTPRPDFTSETITARSKDYPKLQFCAATFAVPVCSLIDETGEFTPSRACQFDRFFTSEKRYCPDNQLGTDNCKVLPGSWYSPVTKIHCDATTPWYSEQKCECITSVDNFESYLSFPPVWVQGMDKYVRTDEGETTYAEVPPCAQEYGQDSAECSFYPWPKMQDTGDHFGVVGASPQGMASPYNLDPSLETSYQTIFSMSNNNCIEKPGQPGMESVGSTVPMAIGEPFTILRGGLQSKTSDNLVWDLIWGKRYLQGHYPFGANLIDKYNPKFSDSANPRFTNGFRELGIPWYLARVSDVQGYPHGRSKTFIDALISQDAIRPYKHYGETDTHGNPRKAVEPYECNKQGVQQFGTCNSKRTWYNNLCQRKKRWYVPDGSQMTLSGQGYVQASEDEEGYAAEFDYTDTESGNWQCNELPPYMPCPVYWDGYAPSGGNYPPQFWDTQDFPPYQMRVWHIRVPVIADMSADAQFCKGINGSVSPDPWVNPAKDWRIIGFIRASLFDNDIGSPPPMPPGPDWIGSHALKPNPMSGADREPTVCSYAVDEDSNGVPDRYPWSFNPTYQPPPADNPSGPPANMGAPANCNMVRARVTCEPGLISGDWSGLPSEPKLPPAIVYSR